VGWDLEEMEMKGDWVGRGGRPCVCSFSFSYFFYSASRTSWFLERAGRFG
jgi:hypothetical protein